MRLSLENGDQWADPDRDDLRNALGSLGMSGNGFAIYDREEEGHFMQVAGAPEEGYTVEYRAGSPSDHYRCRDLISVDEAVDTLDSYAKRNRRWRTRLDWENLERGPDPWAKRLRALFFTLVAVVVFLYWTGSAGSLITIPVISVALGALSAEEIYTGEAHGVGLIRRDERPTRFWVYVGLRLIAVAVGLIAFVLELGGW